MILNRIKPHIDSKLRVNQNGFRTGRSTSSQVLALRRLIEGIKSKNLTAVMTFVDFRKAFDSVHRGKLMQILYAYGIPNEMVSAINILYTNTMAQILFPDGDTSFFEILSGVLQGDTLAPYLFIVCLDYAMRIATTDKQLGFTLKKARSRRHPAVTVTDADFADDIALISDTLDQAEKLLKRVQAAAKIIGLHINESKTEYMTFNIDTNISLMTLDDKELKHVDDFLYLGSWIHSSEKDVTSRIAKAWVALKKMDIVWKLKIMMPLKVAFFKSTVQSVLLYGSNTWTLTKHLERRLTERIQRCSEL